MAETREETISRGMPLIKTLQDAGIQASLYARGPAGKDIFMVGKAPGIPGMIMIWPGAEHVEVTAHTDPELHQAVLVVNEPKRTISQNVQFEIGWRSEEPSLDRINDSSFRRLFTIAMPAGTTFSVTKKRLVSGTKKHAGGRYDTRSMEHYIACATVTARTKATEQALLMGKDEVSQFVAMLPSTPTTVKGAHRILRPSGISAKAVRQGEWFFTPATKEEIALLHAINYRRDSYAMRRDHKSRYMRLEMGSSHMAEHMEIGRAGTEYVKGVIRDTRAGHHRDLFLETWHRVVRNTEVTVTSTTAAARANQPQRRWD